MGRKLVVRCLGADRLAMPLTVVARMPTDLCEVISMYVDSPENCCS